MGNSQIRNFAGIGRIIDGRKSLFVSLSILLLVLISSSVLASSSNPAFFLKVAADPACGTTDVTFDDNPTTGSVNFNGTVYTNGQGTTWTGLAIGCITTITAIAPINQSFVNWTSYSSDGAGISFTDIYSWNTSISTACTWPGPCHATITANYVPDYHYCNSYGGKTYTCAPPPKVDGTIRFVRLKAFQTDNGCLPDSKGKYYCDDSNSYNYGGCEDKVAPGFYYSYWAACSTSENISKSDSSGYPSSCGLSHNCYTVFPADAVVSEIADVQPTYLERFVSGDWYNYLNAYQVPCIYGGALGNDCKQAGSSYCANAPTLVNGPVTVNGCMTLISFLKDSLNACKNVAQSGGLQGCQIIPRVDLVCWEESSSNSNCYKSLGYIDPNTSPCTVDPGNQFQNEMQGIEDASNDLIKTNPTQPIDFISLDNWGPTMHNCYWSPSGQDTNSQYEKAVNKLFSLIYGYMDSSSWTHVVTPGVSINVQTCMVKDSTNWGACSTKGNLSNPWATFADAPVNPSSKSGGNGSTCNNSPWAANDPAIDGENKNGLHTIILYIDSPSPLEYYVCQSGQTQYNAWSDLSGAQKSGGYWLLYEGFQWGNIGVGDGINQGNFLYNGYDWTESKWTYQGTYQSTQECNLMNSNNGYSGHTELNCQPWQN